MQNSVCILLASYNGESYIAEQIESIRSQSYSNWKLVVGDDGSSDSTVKIVLGESKRDKRIHVLDCTAKRVGPKANFMNILEWAFKNFDADYYCFCDQDDLWLPDKVEKLVEEIQSHECTDKKLPILAHSDLCVVNEAQKVIAESYTDMMFLYPKSSHSVESLLARNVVTGCACMFNRSLAELSLPFDIRIKMHDWWLAINASLKGKLVYLDNATVLYRQHGNNAIGASTHKELYKGYTGPLDFLRRGNIDFKESIVQCEYLYEKYRNDNQISTSVLASMRDFAALGQPTLKNKIRVLLNRNFRQAYWLFNLIFIIRVVFCR